MIRKIVSSLLALAVVGAVAATRTQASDRCPADRPCYKEVCRKVCVPTSEVKKTVTPVYDMKCEDLCLPKCTLRSLLSSLVNFGHGSSCPKCGKPREVRKLVKKFHSEDECKTKCVVENRVELVPMKPRKCTRGCPAECTSGVAVPAESAPALAEQQPALPGVETISISEERGPRQVP